MRAPGVGIAVALDHSVFIGVITNIVLAVALTLTADRGSAGALGQVAFWGQNAGLVVFMIGLVSNTQVLKQIGAPLMGVCLLLSLAQVVMRLRESSLVEPAGAQAAAAA